MEDEPKSRKRRKILADGAALLGLTACGAMFQALLGGCESTTLKSAGTIVEFDTSSEPALSAVGGIVKKKLGDSNGGVPVFIIRTAALDFLILNTACTFEGCSVKLPTQSGANLVCPCCGSEYSTSDGHVIKGPAPASFRKFASSYDNTTKVLNITF
ncbi:MAG: Rieske 2Fe-2S domain-containing protein [Candidatus Latescibacter sp.]|nr:Rieske 2Fe-2S domain-containing protein [Candidatus Latescibacter sp.]